MSPRLPPYLYGWVAAAAAHPTAEVDGGTTGHA